MSDQDQSGKKVEDLSGNIPSVVHNVEDVENVEEQQQEQEQQKLEQNTEQPQQIEDFQSNDNVMNESNQIEEIQSTSEQGIIEGLPESHQDPRQVEEAIASNKNNNDIVMTEAVPEQEPETQSIAKPFEVAKDSTAEQKTVESIVPTPSIEQPTTSSTTALQEKSESHQSIDIDSVASFLEVDSKQVISIDNFILTKLQARITEFTDLKSEKTVLEVNLEQSTHLSNKRVDMFKNQLSKVKEDCSRLREEKSSLEASKFQLEKKLAELEMEFNSSSSKFKLNQNKLDEIMSEKRNTVELLEKKNREIENFKNELNQVQESNSKLRKELINLETNNQTSNSNLTHTKFKLQSLETQIDLLTKNNDWLNNEIKTISTDFSNYRKEKSFELSTLQSDYDNKIVEFNSLKTRYDNLFERFEEVSNNLDNSLVQIKNLNDEKSLNQEEFLKEMSLKDRLVKLLTRGNEDAKSKIQHLEQQLESSKFDVANESGVLKTTLDKYKLQLEQNEAKIHQLEETIDDLTNSANNGASLINNENEPATPILSSSAKAAAAKYPGISLSQLYSDFALLKKQLTQERRSKERMQQQIDAFVNELEQKAPLIKATKERVELLENELTELSIILETTSKDKESLEKSHQELTNKLNSSYTQINTLNKQRIDLARQVQSLLVQVSIRGDSQGPMTPAEKEAFNRIVQGDQIVNESDTDRLISDRLVVFQNVVDLQNKNQELLRITRELGNKLEQEEQTSKSRLENLESSAVNEAKEAILTLQDEIKSVETKLNSITRERDMFRSMLSNKSSGNNILTGDLISSDHGNNKNNGNNEEVVSLTRQNEKLQQEFESLQDHFKAVKVESETTIGLLNKQINSLSNEKSELAVSLAREKSSNTLADERYKSLQENIKFAKSENEELRKRSELLQDNLAKQDLRTQQVAEELVQTKSMLESLRSESSNLKAEKQLWKSIEKRLSEENTSLIEEKAKLNALLVNLQTLERERESNAAESQRRLVLQSESLEKELTSLKNKLNENSVELKEALTRKEADSHAYQERIDSLRNDLSSTREDLISKKSSLEQLQSHVDTLSSKLSSAEARLNDYQNITNSGNSQSSLVQETLKLKAELDDARSNLEEANNSVSEFKSIAKAAEDALKSMNETFDHYKENTSSKMTKLESENRALNEQVSVLNDQITSLNNEITEQKNATVKEIEASKLEIETLRSQVSDSSKLQAEYDAKVAVIESSYKQQVAIASEAQQNYDKELQKHAEVAKAVSSLRDESNQLKQTIQELTVDSRQSKEDLKKSQESWESQRIGLEEELRAAKERVDDLSSQNHILYNQIESLSKKQQTATAITSSRERNEDTADDEMNIDDSSEELRELINLLRREKEISDAQLEVCNRDLKRVSQKLEVVTAEFDGARLELSKLQSRDVDAERLTKEHEKLMEELNNLNLFRESNTTLRNELQTNLAKIKELESKLDESNNKLQPLETDVVRLNAEITHKGQELKLTMEERDRWKQRSQDIMNKYNRIDPVEHEKLKEEIKTLTKRNEELNESLEKEKTAHAELLTRFNTLKTEAQDKIKRRGNDNKQLTSQLIEAQNELKALKEASTKSGQEVSNQVKELQEKLDAANKALQTKSDGAVDPKEINSLRSQLNSVKEELARAKDFETKFNELTTLRATLETKIKSLEEEVQRLKKELESKSATAVTSATSNDNLEAVKRAKDDLQAEKDSLEKAKEDLKKEREQFEADKSKGGLSTEEVTSKETALKEQEAKLRAEFEAEAQKKITAGVEEHKNRIREISREKLEQLAKDRVEKFKQQSAEELKAKEKEVIDKCEAQYNQKIEALEKEYKEKFNSIPVTGDAATIKTQYEEQLASVKKEMEEVKKKAFEEAREATVREMGMRTKLLQGKLEKVTKEKKELEQQINTGGNSAQKNPSIPGKPNIPAIPTNQNTSNSKIPVNANNNSNNNNNQNRGKAYNRQQHHQNSGNNQGKQQNEGGSLKRPAADNQTGSKEKKSKSDN